MSAYKPGTVAVATVRGVPNVRVMAGYGTAEPRLRWVTTDARLVDADDEGWWFSYQVTDVRPLVVLDLPKGALAGWHVVIEALQEARLRTGYDLTFTGLIHQIEAQTRPPKPDEPTGLGAVVEDDRGNKWVHRGTSYLTAWVLCDPSGVGSSKPYGAIDAVRVLSEGVSNG